MKGAWLLVLVACSGKAATDSPPPARPRSPPQAARGEHAELAVSGSVTDATTRAVAVDVDVVFASAIRESVATTGRDGRYQIQLPAGAYRVFIRNAALMTIGIQDRVRLQTLPAAPVAGQLDAPLAPELVVDHDAEDVDLTVVRSGLVTGIVEDVNDHPISGAVVSAHGNNLPRPVLGTDVAVTRADGTFELQLPDGEYVLALSHPAYADSVNVGRIETVKGGKNHVSLTMVKGCVITGRIVDAAGHQVATEGALERKVGPTDLEFQPNGRIDSDGTFKWTTTDESEVVLRAWPWHAPPSIAKRFNCRDGQRYQTTFTLPARAPDLSGIIIDRDGGAVAFTHIDIQPLDPGGIAQQERTDEHGGWAVFQVPPGRYTVTAQAPGGELQAPVTSPSSNLILRLSGTGRIEGTTTHLAHGSFELSFGACLDGNTVQLAHDRRLVVVDAGRFTVRDVPACDLQFDVVWHGETTSSRAVVPEGGAARVQLDVGTPRAKSITGVVRRGNGHGAAHARITATYKKQTVSAVADEAGAFTIETVAGATIVAETAHARGEADVGIANVPSERVEIVLVDR